ncbi:MAG: GntR family transcriptional regulator, partial [Alphaproteobacteria bacterium]|nr:GntR family transcriptional regulator [Alphaproteobacteria bacterium]
PALGKSARLQVVKQVGFGVYLDGKELGEILLPTRYVPPGCRVFDLLDVFIYMDSDDKIIATTEPPYVEIGQCACLKVIDKNAMGAFMDWGLSKDLFVPFKEQRVPMHPGRYYVVYVFEDNTGRISASSKLDHFLSERAEGHFHPQQTVELMIASRSALGYKAIINDTHLGLLHNNDALVPLEPGQKITGYIKNIRPDDAIDLSLQQHGEELRHSLTQQILNHLKSQGGTSSLTDKSAADEIFQVYQVSKGNYKKALGQLYKEKKIIISDSEIKIVTPENT